MESAIFVIIILSCFFVIFAISLTILVLFNSDDIDNIDPRMVVLAGLQASIIIAIALIFAAVGLVNVIKYV